MSKRKRSGSAGEENCANCPFTICYETGCSAAEQEFHKHKQRKHHGPDEDKQVQMQISPFSPTGKFKTHESMNLYYTVEPGKRWQDMTRYKSFVLNKVEYYRRGFVRVANERTIEQQKARGNDKHIYKSNEYWVAFILEICAFDMHHVYARVCWMYWPEDLPDGTLDGEKVVQGRQPYHGANELIASNHMDIINVVSVIGPAIVNQWNESHDEEIQGAHYWRQGYDCRNSQLSSVELVRNCQTPANPDKTLIGCTNSERRRWMHHECVAHDILIKVYERLGTDKPHRTEGLVVKEGKPEEATRPLSPTDAEETETQPMIDVRSGETNDSVHVQKPACKILHKTVTPTPNKPTPSRSVATASAKASAKKGHKKNTGGSQPYLGLFKATLRMQDGPIAWEIRELRESVTGGDKAWTEEAHCPCGSSIDLGSI